jgi:hypothetical protein
VTPSNSVAPLNETSKLLIETKTYKEINIFRQKYMKNSGFPSVGNEKSFFYSGKVAEKRELFKRRKEKSGQPRLRLHQKAPHRRNRAAAAKQYAAKTFASS